MDYVRCYATLLKGKKNSNGLLPVYVVIMLNRQVITRVSTKIYVKNSHWSDTKKEIKPSAPNSSYLNTRIRNAIKNIEKKVAPLNATGVITKQDVKAALGGRSSSDLLSFFKDYIDDVSMPSITNEGVKTKLAYNTIKKLQREYNRIKKYQSEIPFSKIDVKWMQGYENYCRETLNVNTSMPIAIRLLLEQLRRAEIAGKYDMSVLAKYKPPKYKNPETFYLTIEQTDRIWEKIENGSLDYDTGLKSLCCYFLIECYAGLRFSDWSRFDIEQIIDKKSIKVTTKKTGKPVYVRIDNSPRLKKVVEYIELNNIHFSLTEQYSNRLLKQVAAQIGLSESFRLTTHVGRHTCAVLHLEKGFSKEYVSELLGISMKTVEVYAKITRRKMQLEYDKIGGI